MSDTIGTTPFPLVGESYGGHLARGLARVLGPRVLGPALICPIGVAVEHARVPSPRTTSCPGAARDGPVRLVS